MTIIINDYELVKKLGQGSYGEVWKGVNIHKKKEVAIKMEKKTLKNTLKYEMIVLRYLKHIKCIPIVKYYGQISKYNYIIMEVLGDTIVDYYNKKNFKDGEIKWLGLKMLECIEEVHTYGIIHRDIKPDNFLLTTDNKDLKIIDFGLAKQYMDKNGNHKCNKKHSNITGTLRYISKYVHEGNSPSRRDDIISIIYILIYLFNSFLPWQGLIYDDFDTKINAIYKMKCKLIDKKMDKNSIYIPVKIVDMLEYAENLKYDDIPKYDYLNLLLKTL
tara:strand:- start:1983 stop:2801 length:819 start_codon:yes stop_codon:yes gene_type:complete